MTNIGLLISSCAIIIQSVHQLYKEVSQLQTVFQLKYSVYQLNDNNNVVNLHDVTNLGLHNKVILVTQKQVLEFYITAIERKTLNGHQTLSQHFPNGTSNNYRLSNATN